MCGQFGAFCVALGLCHRHLLFPACGFHGRCGVDFGGGSCGLGARRVRFDGRGTFIQRLGIKRDCLFHRSFFDRFFAFDFKLPALFLVRNAGVIQLVLGLDLDPFHDFLGGDFSFAQRLRAFYLQMFQRFAAFNTGRFNGLLFGDFCRAGFGFFVDPGRVDKFLSRNIGLVNRAISRNLAFPHILFIGNAICRQLFLFGDPSRFDGFGF